MWTFYQYFYMLRDKSIYALEIGEIQLKYQQNINNLDLKSLIYFKVEEMNFFCSFKQSYECFLIYM